MWWRERFWWYHNRGVLGASIDAVRREKVPQLFLRTDAAKTIGRGAVLSITKGGPIEDMPGDAIQWTRAEVRAFEQLGIGR